MTHTQTPIRHSLHATFFFSSALYLVALLLPPGTFAQVATGTPPFGSFASGPDVINLGNLNVHYTIPVRHKAGRGHNFDYDLTYDSSVWQPVGSSGNQSWQPTSTTTVPGWNGLTPAGVAYIHYSVTYSSGSCGYMGQSSYQMWQYSGFYYFDVQGVYHYYSGITMNYISSPGGFYCPPNGPQPNNTVSGLAGDGSGYTIYVSPAPCCGGAISAYMVDKNGNTISVPVATSPPTSGSITITDRNGNQTTSSNGTYTDTLGTQALAVIGTAPSNTNISFTAPFGVASTYVVSYKTYTVRTNFGCSGITEYNALGTIQSSLVDRVTLPDGSFYQFNYETTYQDTHSPHHVTGRVASVILPTGATISYQYSSGGTGVNAISCSDGSTTTLIRATPDTGSSSWTYTRTQVSGSHWKTTISDPTTPTANQTEIHFQKDSATASTNNFYETQRLAYQGLTSGTLLRQWTTCYNTNTTGCTTTAVSSPITQRNVNDQYGSSGLQCQHNYFYNSTGGLTEQDDYDYGSGGPGALLRKTLVAFFSSIPVFPRTVTICNGIGTSQSCAGASGSSTGTVVAQTTYNYDETTPAPSSGVAQHISVSGARGNLTSINYPFSGQSLTSHFTYWDTGSPNTAQDINGSTVTYNYSSNSASCQMAFPTSISEPLGLSESMTWNCTGGVQLTAIDENLNTTTWTYANDKYYWRPDSITDQINATTNFCYAALSGSGCPSTPSPTQVETYLNFNSNNSTVDSLTTLDSLGRVHVQQRRQGPAASSSNFDSVETDYDALGRVNRVTLPYTGTAGQTNPSVPGTTTVYDPLSRATNLTDGGGGTVMYAFSSTSSDVLITAGPAPTGENTKRRQLEYDALGRLTSVCEVTSGSTSWPGGTCAQNTSPQPTGYWAKYTYDALGDLLTVTQNAQATQANQQTRTYTYDAMGRITSEKNPETNQVAKTYTYDTDATCTPASSGDLVKRIDPVGNTTCYTYDALHRVTAISYPSGSYATNTPQKHYVYDSATVNGVAMANPKTRLVEAYTGSSGAKITDLGLSYTVRGEVSDTYELTPHSNSSYYHVAQTYWPHGRPNQLSSNISGLPTITYGGTIGSTVGLDGEGRITQVTASGTGQQNPVTGVNYNSGNLPTQVNFGSGDSDVFAYDSNTLRMTQFKFNVGTQSQSLTGTLTWNANATLSTLAIVDQFPNTTDSQTCTYSHDDLVRIVSANCGSVANQTFSYDPFGNINKSGSPFSFQPTYAVTTNQMTSLPGNFTPTYDANGNVTNDSNHTYSWDAEGNSIMIDNVGLTFDALDRMTEQNRSSTYTEIIYSPSGRKLALMSGNGGQTLQKAFVDLPRQATAIYASSGLDHYRHADWLGSARLTSSPSRAFLSSLAYAPFGETYAQTGTLDPSFTGQNQDTVSGNTADYDFLFREYSTEGRWPSPDPAGLAAVSLEYPQTWNRYAYVQNDPLAFVDQQGLWCQWDDGSTSDLPPDVCKALGGTSVNSPGCQAAGSYDPACGAANSGTAGDNPDLAGSTNSKGDHGVDLFWALHCANEAGSGGDPGCWGVGISLVNGQFVATWSLDAFASDLEKYEGAQSSVQFGNSSLPFNPYDFAQLPDLAKLELKPSAPALALSNKEGYPGILPSQACSQMQQALAQLLLHPGPGVSAEIASLKAAIQRYCH